MNLLGTCVAACYQTQVPMLAPATSHALFHFLNMGRAVTCYFAEFMRKSNIHIVKVMSLVALN